MNYCPTKSWEHQYLGLISDILTNGDDRVDRTGTGTRALFGKRLDINLKAGFPLITTKKMATKAIVAELLWFLEGSNDERRLCQIQHGTRDSAKTTIWTDNAQADYWKPKAKFDGDVGGVYGVQWRSWPKSVRILNPAYTGENSNWAEHLQVPKTILDTTPIDQIKQLVDKIKNNPTDRRMIVSAWNVAEIDQMALPPCHMMFQVFVNQKKELSLQMYQRSVDSCLGLPFNVASYALLAHMLAHVTGCTVDRLIMNLGDTHIYSDHFDGAAEQLKNTPLKSPVLWLNPEVKNIDDFNIEDIVINDYTSHSPIKFKMSV